ncbi:zinc finger 615-like isoform X2, partial [Pelobates cultripes]
ELSSVIRISIVYDLDQDKMPKCLVVGCRNSHTKHSADCSFFNFPSTPDRIKEWLLATGDEFVNIDAAIQLIIDKQK